MAGVLAAGVVGGEVEDHTGDGNRDGADAGRDGVVSTPRPPEGVELGPVLGGVPSGGSGTFAGVSLDGAVSA